MRRLPQAESRPPARPVEVVREHADAGPLRQGPQTAATCSPPASDVQKMRSCGPTSRAMARAAAHSDGGPASIERQRSASRHPRREPRGPRRPARGRAAPCPGAGSGRPRPRPLRRRGPWHGEEGCGTWVGASRCLAARRDVPAGRWLPCGRRASKSGSCHAARLCGFVSACDGTGRGGARCSTAGRRRGPRARRFRAPLRGRAKPCGAERRAVPGGTARRARPSGLARRPQRVGDRARRLSEPILPARFAQRSDAARRSRPRTPAALSRPTRRWIRRGGRPPGGRAPPQLRHLLAAALVGERAARVEDAARGRVQRRGQLADDADACCARRAGSGDGVAASSAWV